MSLTPGKKAGGTFLILMIVTAITGSLILYWLTIFASINQKVINVRTPSMVEPERLLHYYGLATGSLRGFVASGEEQFIHDFEQAKYEIQNSFKKLQELSK